MDLRLIEDALFDRHRAPGDHPERPERLQAVRRELTGRALGGASDWMAPRMAIDDELRRVHSGSYLAELEHTVRDRSGWLDADTYFNESTWEVAMLAAGAVCDAALGVLAGDSRTAAALVRPPGHHAEADRAMGFCMLNNVAIAAAAARAAGAERVAVVDWDVHHGNGTQHIFEADPTVLFVSLHQHPFYPGTGAPTEIGRDEGEGATINVGLPAGCGDADYLFAMDRVVVPALDAYRPDLILVSAGFDAAAADPLASMMVSADGFRAMAARLRSAADRSCEGRLCAALEGGYDLGALAAGARAALEVLASPKAPESEDLGPPSQLAERAVFATLQAHRDARNRWANAGIS
ncbi:MAG: histone deacetylase [Deltaproteobacteria bacterium]|nr:histone deacetylase [Deltaproteobacteria bacterium]